MITDLNTIYKSLSDADGNNYIPLDNAEIIHNEHGYLSYYFFHNRNGDKGMYIDALYAPNNVLYWKEIYEQIAKQNNCKYIFCDSKRKPQAFEKLLGFQIYATTFVKEVN